MWVLVGPGDTALVPSPSYPIHIYAPLFAGADVRHVRLDAPGAESGSSPGEVFFGNLMEAWESAWPKPRVVVFSFPHNPTTECVDLAWMTRIVEFARRARHRVGPRLRLRRHHVRRVHPALPPPGARGQGRGRGALHDDQVVLDGRLAGRVPAGQCRDRPGADQAEELSRLRHLPAHPDRGDRGHERRAPDYPKVVNETYQAGRDAALRRAQPDRMVDPPRRGVHVRVGTRSPEPYAGWARFELPSSWCGTPTWRPPRVSGFGPGGDGQVRFALIENEQRISQGVRSLRRALTRLH